MRTEFTLKLSQKLNKCDVFPVGCSKTDIQQIQAYVNYPLPEAYKEFLAFMGRQAGKYFDDINIFYNRVFDNQNAAKELLVEDESNFNLSETDFVFSFYQGEQFMYFNLLEGDDPPVYYYIEGAKAPKKTYDRFSECILNIF